jgi:galactoside O-acetyltransferase
MNKAGRLVSELILWWLMWMPTTLGVVIRRAVYRRLMRSGGRFRLEEGIRIVGFDRIAIGDGVGIMFNSSIYAQRGECVIGEGTSINANVHIGAADGRIDIGRKVLIGPNCVLRAADHEFADSRRAISEQGHRPGEIVLEDDVWLGANVVVTRNVRIGAGAVVGAGSVVTSDIPPYAMAAGVPARVIRMRDVTGNGTCSSLTHS